MTRARKGTKIRKWEDAFLESYRVHANVSAAAKAAGVGRTTAYDRRKTNPEFAALWDEAEEMAIDNIALAVTNAALKGDMPTARWFLSRRRPNVWGDRLALEHSGAGGGPIQTDLKVILDALNDPEARDALDALSQRLEGRSSGDSGVVV